MRASVCFAVLSVLAIASASAVSEIPTFEEYLARYNKQYDAAELNTRRAIYEKTVEEIVKHNTLNTNSHTKGVNKFSDWTPSEFQSLMGFDRSLHRHRALGREESSKYRGSPLRPRHLAQGSLPIPDSVNWAKANATTPVKNQGGCGSCWAFAGTEAIESAVYLETGYLLDLAPQFYVDCVANSDDCGGTGGCEGAVPDLLFEFAVKQGARNETEYSYEGKLDVCRAGKTTPVAGITGWVHVIDNDPVALMLAVAKQPVTIGVAASSWATYSGGVVKYSDCDADINHAVLLVGYGTDDKLGDYWVVQNSWGPDWGESGFIRLERSMTEDGDKRCTEDSTPSHGFGCRTGPPSVTVCGTCGILSGSSYPVGGHLFHY